MNNKFIKTLFAVVLAFALIIVGFNVFADNEEGLTNEGSSSTVGTTQEDIPSTVIGGADEPTNIKVEEQSEGLNPKEAILNFLNDTGFKAMF